MIYIDRSVQIYANNINLINGINYIFQDDGDGLYLKLWDIQGYIAPTMDQLQSISDNQVAFEMAQSNKMDENQTNYNSIRNGIKVINDVPINIDPVSSTNIAGKVIYILNNRLSGGQPLTITWMDNVNIGHQYTEDEFISLATTVATTIENIQFKLSGNKLAIQAATTQVDLDAIDTDYSNL
jgi:hypothetical protein